MKEFDLKSYKKTDDYIKHKAKLRFFFEYLELRFYNVERFDNNFFESLDVGELLNSLDYYIDETSPARQTADDYKRDLRRFFDMLRNDYGIKNEVFSDISISTIFEESVKVKIGKLKEQENKECLNDEKLEQLREAIDNFLNIPKFEEQILNEINRNNGKYPQYRSFISVLTLKLVMKYGIGNTAIANLTMQDLDLENFILRINDFNIPLDTEMKRLFLKYISLREHVTSRHDLDSNFLFVDGNGNALFDKNGSANNGVLFYLMDRTLEKTAGKTLGYTTVANLVQKGADIYMLSMLVGTPPTTIFNYSKDCKSVLERKNKIEELLSGSEEKIIKKDINIHKGTLKCPFCGKNKSANSNEWVLVQIDNDETKYLACRECEGDDGKIKY